MFDISRLDRFNELLKLLRLYETSRLKEWMDGGKINPGLKAILRTALQQSFLIYSYETCQVVKGLFINDVTQIGGGIHNFVTL